jgi:hypothetical protein
VRLAPVALASTLCACGTLLGIGADEEADPSPVAAADAAADATTDAGVDAPDGAAEAAQDAAEASAPDVTIDPVAKTRIVFTTSNRWTGDLGGLAGADAKCQAAAGAAFPGRVFRAWISGTGAGEAATERLVHGTGPYTNGPWSIGTGWDQLASSVHDHGIRLDENGNLPQVDDVVWTGTNPDGTALVGATGASCNDWSSAEGGGGTGIAAVGNASSVDAKWTHEVFQTCDGFGHLYCVEQ